MIIVKSYGIEYKCTKAIKGKDFIQLFDNDTFIVGFSGISDFSVYSIEGGEWTFPEPTDKERIAELEALLDALIRGETE